ncbi:MAG TPA: hypothetical protein GX694_09240 [Actinomycetales bacterium]|nr:hypothetical protein [Actinomycetales bacterium]
MWAGPMDGPISGLFHGFATFLTTVLPEPLRVLGLFPFGSAALLGSAGL